VRPLSLRAPWRSATVLTWGAIAARTASTALALPLVVTLYPAAEAAFWFLCAAIFTFAQVAEFGLSATFVRFISYGFGGARMADLSAIGSARTGRSAAPDADTLFRLAGTAKALGARLALTTLVLALLLGNLALARPIAELANPTQGWLAAQLVFLALALRVWGQAYASLLQGMNRMRAFRSIELAVYGGQFISILAVFLMRGNILMLVLATHLWPGLAIVLTAWACRRLDRRIGVIDAPARIDPHVWRSAWPAMWRSGLAAVMSVGLLQGSGLVFAQIVSPAQVTAYLFHLRLINLVRELSTPPFLNAFPGMAQIMAAGRIPQLRSLARRAMAASYWIYALGVLVVGTAAAPLLDRLFSGTMRFSTGLWLSFAAAFFLERYAHMHVQLYTLTNRVVWHLLASASGAAAVAAAVLLYPVLGVAALPAGYALGLLLIAVPVTARLAYRTFSLAFPGHELISLAAPAGLFLLYVLLVSAGG